MIAFLLAQVDSQSGVQSRVVYEWTRLAAMHQWWHFAVLALVVAAIAGYVFTLYRRDWVELPRGLGWSLLLLRLIAFGGILLFFLNLQKRSEQPIVRASRVAVLVDSSLSMSLPVGDPADSTGDVDLTTVAIDSQFPDETRIEQIIRTFGQSELLTKLADDHELTVYRFEGSERPASVAAFAKRKSIEAGGQDAVDADWSWRTIYIVAWIGAVLLVAGLIILIATMAMRLLRSWSVINRKKVATDGNTTRRSMELAPDGLAYITLAAVVMLISGAVCVGTATMRGSDYRFANLWSWQQPAKVSTEEKILSAKSGNDLQQLSTQDPRSIQWQDVLATAGSSTRLGDAIATIIAREQNSPLAGILVLTDGQNNAGLSAESAAGQATAADVPLLIVGLGSATEPINVRMVDVDAPRRIFPGDRFRVSATLQANGLEGKPLTVQLRRRAAKAATESANTPINSNFVIEQEQTVNLPADGQLANVNFEVMPPKIGAYSYDVKLLPPANDANSKDDALETDVEVIEPRATVLIFAGGPTREYQFVRNLLYRDVTVQSHLLLQTGGPGMSQEADELLTEFPTTDEQMAAYDCVLCFDADFLKLDQASVDVLEKWVSSGAGGLVVVAGSVATPEWTGSSANTDRRAAMMRDMSPVVLNSRVSRLVSLGRFEGETVWPLRMINDLRAADFLDVANSLELSQDVWKQFSGVYSFYATYKLKPGATAMAYFSDPTTTIDGELPIYIASQFYGGGRVVFQGSGEIWRLRESDESYFDTYWTKLVRWVAQGRLLRDSDYGLLLTDREEALLGDQITVRAVLRDQQFQPLRQASVTANLIDPSGRLSPLTLQKLPGSGQDGVFVGQFLLRQAGKYQLRLDTRIGEDSVLSRQVVSQVPTKEIQRPKRNDPLLLAMAKQSGGSYFVGVKNAIEGLKFSTKTKSSDTKNANQPLTESILPRDQITFQPGAPDREFQQRWMTVLMLSIAGALSLEWLLRRLSRLA